MSEPQGFQCQGCGASLQYAPGTRQLECPYCSHTNVIAEAVEAVEELDFREFLAEGQEGEELEERVTITCDGCKAELTFDANVTAQDCVYCGSPIVAQGRSRKVIKPRSLLPFKIDRKEALRRFREWISKLWFAPSKLKRFARVGKVDGLYTPAWTYDCQTTTRYSGERGEHYWENQSYNTTENGRSVTKTRRVQKTRWYPASGVVSNAFDDLLVLASRSLPDKQARLLEPWDLGQLVPYQGEYLSGFRVESYATDLEEGFGQAQKMMEPQIHGSICRDIGGDAQRIHSQDTSYQGITFKHILLPMWITSFRYGGRVFRVLVNARTGEVQGERPYSWIKITFFVLMILALVIAFGYFFTSL